MAEKFWGKVFGTAAKAIILPVAAGKGLLNIVNGDSFDDGVEHVYDYCKSTTDEIEEFGDENNNGITTALNSAVGIVTLIATGKKHGGSK